MDSALDLSFSEDQQAIGAAVDRFCQQHDVENNCRKSGGVFPRELWLQLAQLGVFAPAAPGTEDSGGALEACAISEILGHHIFPGPISATYLAIQVLDPEQSLALIDGRSLVSLSARNSTLLPWGLDADLFLVADKLQIFRGRAPQRVTAVQTLGGDPWGRGVLEVECQLRGASPGWIMANISAAAYLASAGLHLVRDASEYAGTRKQFGKAIGDFQAISHPLADCMIALTAAQTMARAAACSFDGVKPGRSDSLDPAERLAAGAAISARAAALQSAYVCHQVFAGIGITLEGPAFHISRRIRQLVSEVQASSREQTLLLTEIGLGV